MSELVFKIRHVLAGALFAIACKIVGLPFLKMVILLFLFSLILSLWTWEGKITK